MFRDRLFSAGILSLFLIAGTLSAINFLLPFYLQYLLGYSPSQVGWIIVADSVVIMIMAPIAGALSDRLGSRLLCTIGCAIVAIAQFFLASLDIQASLPRIMVPLVIWGVGWALFNAPNQSSILGAVSYQRIGAAAGMIATTARAGGAMGVALSATLFGHLSRPRVSVALKSAIPRTGAPRPRYLWTRSARRFTCLICFTALAIIFSAVRGQRRVD